MIKVLLVENEPELLGEYALELERNGFGIITASDGNEALGKFVEQSPEIVILEHEVPNPCGTEVLRKILTIRPQTKVIMLTKEGQQVDEAEQIGLELFLLKPVAPQILVKSVIALSVLKGRPSLMVVTR